MLVGTAAARSELRWWVFLCAMGVAVFVQIATNYANDYSDGRRGTDDPTARVGPPRLVGNGLATPGEVKRAMLVAFGLTALFGTPLVLFVDWRLVFVGVAAIAAGWFYTGGSRPHGYAAGFGEVFVFVFFGLVATVGSFYVQALTVTWLPVVAGVALGCLATALLVVNNLRDIPGDTAVGKQTLAVAARGPGHPWAVRGPDGGAVPAASDHGRGGGATGGRGGVRRAGAGPSTGGRVLGGARGARLIAVLGDTGRVQLVYGLLVALGFLIGG